MTGEIFSMERFSIHDGPGIRTSIFFKGCPLHCIWCHNPESHERGPVLQYLEKECVGCAGCVSACPSGVHSFINGKHRMDRGKCTGCGQCCLACPGDALRIRGKACTAEEVLQVIGKDRPYYGEEGGVTLSGGEPLLQPDFAAEILRLCKERGIGTCVETAGDVSQKAFLKVLADTDLFLYDYKLDTQEQMDRYTGGSLKRIRENLELLAGHGKKVVLRCPIIPGINDTREHLKAIAELADRLSIADTELMPYHGYGEDKWRQIGKEYALSGLPNMEKETADICRRQLAGLRAGCHEKGREV